MALMFLVVIVPSIFAVAGGYDALVEDTVVWDPADSTDYTVGNYDTWGLLVDQGVSCTQTGDAGWSTTTAVDWWSFPDELEENYTTGLIDLTSSSCSATAGTSIGIFFWMVVDPADLLTKNADQLKIWFRTTMADGRVSFESHGMIEPDPDGGFWTTATAGGIEPNFLYNDHKKRNYTQDVWLEHSYTFTRASLLAADQSLQSSAQGRFTLMMNLSYADYSPDDWDGEVVDIHFGFYSEGGGYSLWGDVFGWSLGLLMIVMAAASTPYWNPTRKVEKRHWRRKRRY
jgi:hypothetical protein